MVQNTNNLLESLDFKGIFSLLKSQIDKTEKLHVTIQNIREENFDLRKEFEKSRATIVNKREENFHLRKNLSQSRLSIQNVIIKPSKIDLSYRIVTLGRNQKKLLNLPPRFLLVIQLLPTTNLNDCLTFQLTMLM